MTKPKQKSAPARWQNPDELRWAVRNWVTKIGVKSVQVYVRPMKRKWASMSSSGRMTLDAYLLKLPKELGEYVIVHELVHRLAPNHGKVFKSFMLAYLPDWEEREARLQQKAKPRGGTSQKRTLD
jgi:predicted metal-dependent hydrolase